MKKITRENDSIKAYLSHIVSLYTKSDYSSVDNPGNDNFPNIKSNPSLSNK